MALADALGIRFSYQEALILSAITSLAIVLYAMPIAIRKLKAAGIVGRDRHKEDRPEVPEMGGLVVFLGFMGGAFIALGLGDLPPSRQIVILAALVTLAGAAFTGALDDLLNVRQRFKSILALLFSAPLVLFLEDSLVWFPFLGQVDLGYVYLFLLVPLAVAFTGHGFNILEGFNGLGAGLGIIMGLAMSILILLHGNPDALVISVPMTGALAGFYVFNAYPAKVFPGDTLTILAGASFGVAAIVGDVEFWGGVLFLPHLVEFGLKARSKFKAQSFADRMEGGKMFHDGPIHSLTHLVMKVIPGMNEGPLVRNLHIGYIFIASTAVVSSLFAS